MAQRCGPHSHLLLLVLATGLLLASGPIGILAQTSNATCLSSYNWMDNSKGQTPCLVAAYLQGACNGGQWTINPLPNGTHYIGPTAGESNTCQCSSVTYSTISACGICQGQDYGIEQWTTWTYNCTNLYLQVFQQPIPDGTAVPAWAYQNVSISNTFNVTLAQSIGDEPEATPTNSQTTVGSTSTPTSSAPVSGSSTSSTVPKNVGTSSNTAAVAGGVVGGVVGVALIAAAIVFFMMRKKRSRISLSAQSAAPGVLASPDPSSVYPDSSFFSPQMAQPRLYDPSDPSTFPTSPPPPTFTTGSIHMQDVNYSSPSVRPGGYSGAPEV